MTNFSKRARQLSSSAIREILKITASEEVISFAGGIPAPETFPIEIIKNACSAIFAKDTHSALQYSLTEGFFPFRTWIAERHSVSSDWVLITTGSQQALDLLAKAFIDSGDKVLLESPSYLGALQAFSLFEPEFSEMPCDVTSLVPDEINDDHLSKARFAYVMPNFQNPTGRSIPLDRRLSFSKLMKDAGVLIVEDDPYQQLRYSGRQLPSLQSLNPDGVAYLGSFSKILAPGLRVGYVVASPWLIDKLVQIKQAADLHTSSFDQRLVYEVIRSGMIEEQVASICRLYISRRDAMLESLARYMPQGVVWNKPDGGMFIWMQLPDGCDSHQLLKNSIDTQSDTRVAFVPGASFYSHDAPSNTLRLSFVTVPPERIEQGVKQLAKNIQQLTL